MSNFKRHIAIAAAFMQLFFAGMSNANADNTDYSLVGSLGPKYMDVVLDKNDTVPVYKRKNTENGDTKTISIFDIENLATEQYGASQSDFKRNFAGLNQDPYIAEEMKNEKLLKGVKTIDDALAVCEEYYNIICESGCGFAAATDFIFRQYEGDEERFYKTFGFPMYEYKHYKIDFNYEPFMVKFFNFYVKNKYGSMDPVRKTIKKRLCEKELEECEQYIKDTELSFKELQTVDKTKYKELKESRQKKKERINVLKKNIKNIPDYTYGIVPDEKFGYLKKFLAQYGVKLKVTVNYESRTFKVNDIVGSENATLYNLNGVGYLASTLEGVGAHYVYVTDITEDGKIVVSTWGKLFILDVKDVTSVERVVLKLTKK